MQNLVFTQVYYIETLKAGTVLRCQLLLYTQAALKHYVS
jgi:hypothetical protein